MVKLIRIGDFYHKRLDWILILSGSFLSVYNFLSFSIEEGGKHARGIQHLFESPDPIYAYAYYYHWHDKFLVALGVVLLISGILLRQERRKI